MKLPSEIEIMKAAMDHDNEYSPEFGQSNGRAFTAGANWHREQIAPLLDRVRETLEYSEGKIGCIQDGSSQERWIKKIRETIALLSEEEKK